MGILRESRVNGITWYTLSVHVVFDTHWHFASVGMWRAWQEIKRMAVPRGHFCFKCVVLSSSQELQNIFVCCVFVRFSMSKTKFVLKMEKKGHISFLDWYKEHSRNNRFGSEASGLVLAVQDMQCQ